MPCQVAGSDLGPASDLRAWVVDLAPGRPRRRARTKRSHDPVVLTTFHRSKGLQWPTVMIIGLSTGLMPLASAQTQEAIDEERRLLYVALTRAEEELWCSWSAGDDGARRRARLEPQRQPLAGAAGADHRAADEGGGADGSL